MDIPCGAATPAAAAGFVGGMGVWIGCCDGGGAVGCCIIICMPFVGFELLAVDLPTQKHEKGKETKKNIKKKIQR